MQKNQRQSKRLSPGKMLEKVLGFLKGKSSLHQQPVIPAHWALIPLRRQHDNWKKNG